MLSKSQLKYIQSLGQKKRRDEDSSFIAEGPKLAIELIAEKSIKINGIYATAEWKNAQKNIDPSIVTEVTADELEKISQLQSPNQVLVVAEKIKWKGEPTLKDTLTLALDTIQDPGNLGTIIRIADWFGIKQVICSHECADVYNPKVVQASMGSIVRVRVDYTDLLPWLEKNKDVRTYAATLDGRNVREMEKLREAILLIGNESKGLNEALLAKTNVRITIPGKGQAESLNAAVATGIILSHLT